MARGFLSRAAPLLAAALSIALAGCGSKAPEDSSAIAKRPSGGALPVVDPSIHHDESPPLRTLMMPPEKESQSKDEHERDVMPLPGTISPSAPASDPVLQKGASNLAAPVSGAGFDGIGQGFTGPAGTFAVNSAPPDPDLAVGPSHVVQIVNAAIAVFNKSGAVLFGPTPTNGAVDRLRWRLRGQRRRRRRGRLRLDLEPLGHLAVLRDDDAVPPVRRGLDERRSHRQLLPLLVSAGELQRLPEDGRVARRVLRDLQHVQRQHVPRARASARTTAARCCSDRRRRRSASAPATRSAACSRRTSTADAAAGGLAQLLAELHDQHAEPVAASTSTGRRPMSSTLSGPVSVAGVAAFSAACGGGTCIPQAGTTPAARLARRPADVPTRLPQLRRSRVAGRQPQRRRPAAAWACAGTRCGTRAGAASVFQQGTYAPDASYRWMGSAAMDHSGDIAPRLQRLEQHPQARASATRAASRPIPLGTMQAEAVFFNGAGSQSDRR